ncbi:MAG: transporter [Bacteroidales bacterium]|nr:transporter [Bacteroidales bacterium]
MKKLFTTFIGILSVLYLFAQETTPPQPPPDIRPMITDRPDQTESSINIPKYSLQIESGIVFESEKAASYDTENWGIGTTLIRYGLFKTLELRLATYYQTSKSHFNEIDSDSILQGFGPLVAGFKVFVVREKGLRPQISILADMTLRHLGNETIRPTYSYPTAKILASHTLSPKWNIGYNAGFGYNGEKPDGFFIYSFTTGYSVSSNLGTFIEIYGNFDHGDNPNHKVDAGFTYLVKDNFQLDLSFGIGLNANITKSFISTGFSWRI